MRASTPVLFLSVRDSKFTTVFDAVFVGAEIRIIRTPIQAPRAKRDR